MNAKQHKRFGLASPQQETKALARGRPFLAVLIPESGDEYEAKCEQVSEILKGLAAVPGCFTLWIKPAPENQE